MVSRLDPKFDEAGLNTIQHVQAGAVPINEFIAYQVAQTMATILLQLTEQYVTVAENIRAAMLAKVQPVAAPTHGAPEGMQ